MNEGDDFSPVIMLFCILEQIGVVLRDETHHVSAANALAAAASRLLNHVCEECVVSLEKAVHCSYDR